jgi:hypothetical protein
MDKKNSNTLSEEDYEKLLLGVEGLDARAKQELASAEKKIRRAKLADIMGELL